MLFQKQEDPCKVGKDSSRVREACATMREEGMKVSARRSSGEDWKNVSLGVALKSKSCYVSSLAPTHTHLHTVPVSFPLASI